MHFKFKNLFYFGHINAIGGIETFFYNLARQVCDKVDLTIVYRTGDPIRLKRLSEVVRVIRYQPGMTFECEKAFFNFNTDIIDCIEANEYIQCLHGDYKSLGVIPDCNPKITRWVGVSKTVCDAYTELTGRPTELYYNPMFVEKQERILHLMSATRLTSEKGKHRIEKMAKLLDESGIPYSWTIFTNDTDAIQNKNIIWAQPTIDITPHVLAADYLVQLSDSEGYCYSVVESLCLGTPVIVTDMPVISEIGVKHGKNGFIVDYDLSNFNPKEIYDAKLTFKYDPPTSDWTELFYKSEPTYNKTLEAKYLVEALPIYRRKNIVDSELGRIPNPGEKFTVDYNRLISLTGANVLGMPFVKLIEELPCQ
jgi:hypothetical protein